MSDKLDLSDIVDGDYMIDGESAAQLIISLLQLVIAFIGIEKAKSLLSQMAIQQANAAADVAEVAKFGSEKN